VRDCLILFLRAAAFSRGGDATHGLTEIGPTRTNQGGKNVPPFLFRARWSLMSKLGHQQMELARGFLVRFHRERT
jgi:hypothetical protein